VTRRHTIPSLVPALVLAGITTCTLGDGEGADYTGRVTRVSPQQLCVGPNPSSEAETCGVVPAGFTDLPGIGTCVSPFAHFSDEGRRRTWTEANLRLKVDDSECQSSTATPATSG
jgi:hypothetical protein